MQNNKGEGFHTIPSATGGIARLAISRLRELGKDIGNVLSGAKLSLQQVDDPTARLEVRAQIKVLELVAAELQDDFLGFHLARNFELREVGLVYYVMACSEHLAAALRNGERYSKISNEGVRVRFISDGTTTIRLDYVNVDRGSDRHQIEFWMVALVRLCRQLTDNRLAPHHVRLRHGRANIPPEMKAFFGVDIEFEAGADEIVFAAPVASLPIVARDPYLNDLLRRYADEALASRPKESASLRSRIERILSELLPHGDVGLQEVARRLGMSSRTLSRNLSEEGATYTEILDQFRASLAKRYLTQDDLPISKMAWLLGYREVSSFTNAFKKWTGETPRQFRGRTPEAVPTSRRAG